MHRTGVKGLGRLAIVAILAAGLGLAGPRGGTRPVNGQQTDPAAVVQQFVDAMNQGDVDTAMAAFASRPSIVYAGFGPCQVFAPCVGADAIRQGLVDETAVHQTLILSNVQVFGSVVVGQTERRNDFITCEGNDRILTTFTAEVVPAGIVDFVDLPDVTDPQTIANGAKVANPDPACT